MPVLCVGTDEKPADEPGAVQCVKLDAFHAMKRLTEVLPKNHGARRHFCSRLRDAIFVVNQADIDDIKTRMKAAGLTDAEIQHKYRHKYYQCFLRRIRRRIPSAEEVVERLDTLVTLYANVLDGVTKQRLFSDKAWKEVRRNGAYITAGSLQCGFVVCFIEGTCT
jgi:uncharacterized protein YnzC (UPF0291/DUF896 family)